jgi:hypothetical protein
MYTEALGAEYGNDLLFGQAHQLTVDSHAVQHAGGQHPDKSIAIHLCGLYLVLHRGLRPTRVPPLLQRLSDTVQVWPHFPPPTDRGALAVGAVAHSDSVAAHMERVREWAASVWGAWSQYHSDVADFVGRHVR